MPDVDDDAVVACADLVGRSGAKEFEAGYLHDGVPTEQAGWWAKAQYQGARIIVEDQRGPVEACDALARRILAGATCTHCGREVSLSDGGKGAWRKCRWTRMGRRWMAGCHVSDES